MGSRGLWLIGRAVWFLDNGYLCNSRCIEFFQGSGDGIDEMGSCFGIQTGCFWTGPNGGLAGIQAWI